MDLCVWGTYCRSSRYKTPKEGFFLWKTNRRFFIYRRPAVGLVTWRSAIEYRRSTGDPPYISKLQEDLYLQITHRKYISDFVFKKCLLDVFILQEIFYIYRRPVKSLLLLYDFSKVLYIWKVWSKYALYSRGLHKL